MADMSDLQGWAQRAGGEDHGEGEGGGESPGEEEQESQTPPCEVYRHAGMELQEAIDMLERMQGDDDQEWRAELISGLQETQTALSEKADEMEENEDEEDASEEDEADAG